MEEEQQQQLHRGVIDGIVRLDDPQFREERHKLIVDGYFKPPVDRQSWDHLVNFLDDRDSHEVRITELDLDGIQLSHPSDGGLEVLRNFFSRSDTTLTKVTLRWCNFGRAEDASHLLTAFQTNRTVSDLTIRRIRNLEGAALGACVSTLMQNMPQLHRLDCHGCNLRVEGVRALQPALQANRTLRELNLSFCRIGNYGIHLIVDGLIENRIMKLLDISGNVITSIGLDNITRLLESTQLRKIDFGYDSGVFNDTNATLHFVATLQAKNSSVQELPGLGPRCFPESSSAATYANISNSLTRNKQLNRVNLLLAPPPTPQQQRNAGTMMLKTWHKAITKFAMVPNNAGASAIFKLFTARPQLLEKRLKRPASAAAAVSHEQKRQRF